MQLIVNKAARAASCRRRVGLSASMMLRKRAVIGLRGFVRTSCAGPSSQWSPPLRKTTLFRDLVGETQLVCRDDQVGHPRSPGPDHFQHFIDQVRIERQRSVHRAAARSGSGLSRAQLRRAAVDRGQMPRQRVGAMLRPTRSSSSAPADRRLFAKRRGPAQGTGTSPARSDDRTD